MLLHDRGGGPLPVEIRLVQREEGVSTVQPANQIEKESRATRAGCFVPKKVRDGVENGHHLCF
jgi:hypothetical protein